VLKTSYQLRLDYDFCGSKIMAVARLSFALGLLCLSRLQSTFAQENKQVTRFSAEGSPPRDSIGLTQVENGSITDLDRVDSSRWQRKPNETSSVAFMSENFIDLLELNLFFPKEGDEKVVVSEAEAGLTALDAVRAASAEKCNFQAVTSTSPLSVCPIGQDWLNVTWAVPLQECTKKATVRLTGMLNARSTCYKHGKECSDR
jgi:hypothetical protein